LNCHDIGVLKPGDDLKIMAKMLYKRFAQTISKTNRFVSQCDSLITTNLHFFFGSVWVLLVRE